MKITIVIALLYLCGTTLTVSSQPVTESIANRILKKTSDKLNRLDNIRYNHKRELNYSSENYHNETNWTVYFDFKSTDTIINARYLIEDETLKQVFNGTEKFELNKTSKTIAINEQPDQKAFSGSSAFYNSLYTLKNVLPLLIADNTIAKHVSDTTLNNTPCYLVTLNLNKRRIKNLGKGFDAMTTKSNFIYKIIIDKKDELPREVLQVNDVNNDFIKTSFTNIQSDNYVPSELSWYYSTYTDEYKPAKSKDQPQLIQVGSYAPAWLLPLHNKDENVALANLKGKVVLLDFWIKNCGPCIKSIPELNALKERFKNKKFEIFGINSYDAKEEINSFCNKHKPTYTILMQGKPVAEKYGVDGFPTVVLIDKEGKVIFAGTGLEKAQIEKMIEAAL
jgi:thiol-disulfide isomerase/thioredoxin